jgi:hypothetical protein
MVEATRIYRYSAWQRFWQLEMPYAAIGLVWNSIVSVAGGWFALIACEMFTMGDRSFQLPGLGSYLQTATANGDIKALVAGFAAVILIVVATDQLIWRPLIAWSDKFKFEQVQNRRAHLPPPGAQPRVPGCSATRSGRAKAFAVVVGPGGCSHRRSLLGRGSGRFHAQLHHLARAAPVA